MRANLLLCLTLAACSADAVRSKDSTYDPQREVRARIAYANCLKAKALELRSAPVSIEVAAEIAVSRCLAERDEFTFEWIRAAEGDAIAVLNSSRKVPMDLRDSFERNMLRSVRRDLAAARGVKWEERPSVDYQ